MFLLYYSFGCGMQPYFMSCVVRGTLTNLFVKFLFCKEIQRNWVVDCNICFQKSKSLDQKAMFWSIHLRLSALSDTRLMRLLLLLVPNEPRGKYRLVNDLLRPNFKSTF